MNVKYGNDTKESAMNAKFWFANIAGISDKEKRKLLHVFGREEELYRLTENEIGRLKLLPEKTREALLAAKKDMGWQKKLEDMRAQGVSLICWQDKEYPEKLKNLYDPPYCLYVRGRLPGREQKTAAIVGARSCSGYGEAAARTIACELAKYGVGVISGMAYGIDAAAHIGALEAVRAESGERGSDDSDKFIPPGLTYAVLGCGADVCYPAAHRRLYRQIIETGGIISEVPMGTPPMRHLFPRRNRLISGLADVIVIVEARARSGSLITADCALEQGKAIYAVPGRISDELSYGANWLLSQGAAPLYSVDEFLKDLQVKKEPSEKFSEKFIENSLEKNERLVYSVLDFNPRHLETLLEETGLDLNGMLKALCRLRERGYVEEIHQNYYTKSRLG